MWDGATVATGKRELCARTIRLREEETEMVKIVFVKDYGMAVELLIDGQGYYSMSKTLWEEKALPELTKRGYKIEIFQASDHEVAELEDRVKRLFGIPDNKRGVEADVLSDQASNSRKAGY